MYSDCIRDSVANARMTSDWLRHFLSNFQCPTLQGYSLDVLVFDDVITGVGFRFLTKDGGETLATLSLITVWETWHAMMEKMFANC